MSLCFFNSDPMTPGAILGSQDKDNTLLYRLHNTSPTEFNNLYVFGGSSSGKTSCYSKVLCLQAIQRGESLVISDPKGEMYDDMCSILQQNGYKIRRLNMADPSHSDCWDFLACAGNTIDSAYKMADVVCDNISLPDSYYIQTGARYLLAGAMLTANLHVKQTNLVKPLNLVMDILRRSDTTSRNRSGEVMGADVAHAYSMVNRLSAEQQDAVGFALADCLRDLNNQDVVSKLSKNDFDFTALPKEKCAYFVQMPYGWSNTFRFVHAVFFSKMFETLYATTDSMPNGRCNVPVNIIFDDFDYAGNIMDFKQYMAQANRKGIIVDIVGSTLSSLKKQYPHSWQEILNCCGAWVLTSATDSETMNYFADCMGKEIQTRDRIVDVESADDIMQYMRSQCSYLIVWPGKIAKFAFPFHCSKLLALENGQK